MIEYARLAEPFDIKDLEWRVQSSGNTRAGKPYAMVVCYIDNRAIQKRLDEVCGPENWRNEFREWTVGGKPGVLCGISIRCGRDLDGDPNNWVTKWDGADPTDIEPIKGGLSDSMKRAAVHWGIGRYLYELDSGFATILDDKVPGAKKQGKEPDSFWWLPPKLPAWAVPTPAAKSAVKNAESVKSTHVDSVPAIGPPTPQQLLTIAKMQKALGVMDDIPVTEWDATTLIEKYKQVHEQRKGDIASTEHLPQSTTVSL